MKRFRQLGPSVWLATGFGVGFVPYAPGTFGSLLGLPLAWGIAQIPSIPVQAVVIVAICLAGVPISTAAARRLGGKKDPQAIVLDEIAAVPIAFFLVPVELMNSPWTLAAGFALFRLFDVTKPPPARQLERLPDGWGVMADDWIAGIFAAAALHLLIWIST